VQGNSLQVLVASPKQASDQLPLENIQIAPFGVLIAEVK
jgi:hypothetical protein